MDVGFAEKSFCKLQNRFKNKKYSAFLSNARLVFNGLPHGLYIIRQEKILLKVDLIIYDYKTLFGLESCCIIESTLREDFNIWRS